VAIGDVWRCAISGHVGEAAEPPLGDHSLWVNVLHLQTIDGAGTETEEGDGAIEGIVAAYQEMAFGELFGEGCFLTNIEAINQRTSFNVETGMQVNLGTEEILALPSQVSMAVTGRNDVEGRRVTLYLAGITEAVLGQWGQMEPTGQEQSVNQLFGTKFGGAFSYDCVIFDRDGVLPTKIITRYKISKNFRTQRRRSLTATNSFVTEYAEVSG